MWIWSISIPSERERRVASFIRSFLDCISPTYEVPLLRGNLLWHVKFHTEITYQFTFSPKVDMNQLISQTTPTVKRTIATDLISWHSWDNGYHVLLSPKYSSLE